MATPRCSPYGYQPVGNLVRAPAGNPRLHLNAGYLTFSPSATVISHRHRLFKKLHSLLSSIRRIIQTRGHSCARTSRPSCRLDRGLTPSDRFYTPALIRPTSGSDGSCHSLWSLLAASRQRYWLPRNVHASSFMEFHACYSRKVSAYTDLETALLTLFLHYLMVQRNNCHLDALG